MRAKIVLIGLIISVAACAQLLVPDSEYEVALDLIKCHESKYSYEHLEFFTAGELKFGFCACQQMVNIYAEAAPSRENAILDNQKKILRVLNKKSGESMTAKNCVAAP